MEVYGLNCKTIPFITLLSILFLTGIYLEPVRASSIINLGTGYATDADGNRLQQKFCITSTDKIVTIGYLTAARANIMINTVESTGTILSTVNIDVSTIATDYYGTWASEGVYSVAIYPYDANNVIIIGSYKSTGGAGSIFVIMFNFNTFNYVGYKGGVTTHMVRHTSEPYLYNGKYYWIGIETVRGYTTTYSVLYSYNPTNHVITTEKQTSYANTNNAETQLYTFISGTKIYLSYSLDTFGTYELYFIDLNSIASGFQSLATKPISGGVITNAKYNNTFTTQIGGGVYHEVTSTFYYLYQIWCYATKTVGSNGIREVNTVMWVTSYNNSITSGNLIANIEKDYTSMDSSGSLNAESGIQWGYYTTSGATNQQFDIYTVFQDIQGGKYQSLRTNHVNDITAMLGTFDTAVYTMGVDNIYFTYISDDEQVAKNPSYGVSFHLTDNTHNNLAINEGILTVSYTDSFSYIPSDNPLLTLKQYTLTWVIYKNGVISNDGESYLVVVNGVTQKTGTVQAGNIVATVMFQTSNTYTVGILLYNPSTTQAYYISSLTSLTVINVSSNPNTIPSSGLIVGQYAFIFTGLIPIVVIVMLPAFIMAGLMGHFAGGTGAILGLMFGGAIGTIAGITVNIIPMYVLYLFALMLGTGFIFMLKGTGGGGDNSGGS